LRGWQWLYLVEGVPSLLAGIAAMFFLEDSPQKAKWLADGEKLLLLNRLHEEEVAKQLVAPGHHSLRDAFRSYRVWLLCVGYFGSTRVIGTYSRDGGPCFRSFNVLGIADRLFIRVGCFRRYRMDQLGREFGLISESVRGRRAA